MLKTPDPDVLAQQGLTKGIGLAETLFAVELLVFCMHLQDVLAALQVRHRHTDLPVKPAGPQQRRVGGTPPPATKNALVGSGRSKEGKLVGVRWGEEPKMRVPETCAEVQYLFGEMKKAAGNGAKAKLRNASFISCHFGSYRQQSCEQFGENVHLTGQG